MSVDSKKKGRKWRGSAWGWRKKCGWLHTIFDQLSQPEATQSRPGATANSPACEPEPYYWPRHLSWAVGRPGRVVATLAAINNLAQQLSMTEKAVWSLINGETQYVKHRKASMYNALIHKAKSKMNDSIPLLVPLILKKTDHWLVRPSTEWTL